MRIYIVRHGIAEDHPRVGSGDAARQLSEEGKKKMKEAAAGFARLEPEVDSIFSSPLIRAVQTAEIIAKPLKKEVQGMKELEPGHTPAEVCEALRKAKKRNSVMLVGHEPNCSELASYLLTSSRMDVEFKKGAVCLLETNDLAPGSGVLVWHLSPQVLRLMAG